MTNPAAAKYQWLAAPVISPGSCGGCGKAEHAQGFVHTGLDFEFYGTLIFCSDCALELGAAIGGMRPSEFHDLLIRNTGLRARCDFLEKQLQRLESLRDAINDYNAHNGITVPNSDNVRELVQPEESSPIADETVIGSELTGSEFTEPVSEPRSDDSTDVTSGEQFDVLAELGIT